MNFVDTFDRHRNEPNKTIGEYARELCIALGTDIQGYKIVYLDTKFWVILRNAKSGDNSAQELLGIITELAEANQCIFPIGEDIFYEILKQTDKRTLIATVDLIDKLSRGVSICSFKERLRIEVLQFIYEKYGKEVHKSEMLVWTKLAYVLGYITPSLTQLDFEKSQLIQKSFMDQMWSQSLKDMIETIEANAKGPPPVFPDVSETLNKGKFSHQKENHTFEQMFLTELAGLLDVFKNEFSGLMCYIYEQETGNKLTEEEHKQDDSEHLIANVVYNVFREHKIRKELPTFRIKAGIHAAIRWDKAQKYQENDMRDIGHATAALPYCDYFFTEDRLAHIVTQKMLSFDKLYSCNVQSKILGAVRALRGIQG